MANQVRIEYDRYHIVKDIGIIQSILPIKR